MRDKAEEEEKEERDGPAAFSSCAITPDEIFARGVATGEKKRREERRETSRSLRSQRRTERVGRMAEVIGRRRSAWYSSSDRKSLRLYRPQVCAALEPSTLNAELCTRLTLLSPSLGLRFAIGDRAYPASPPREFNRIRICRPYDPPRQAQGIITVVNEETKFLS